MARLFDMHVHTNKGSSDSNLTPEDMILQSERLGFFGICVTEHSGPWDQHEFKLFAEKHNQTLIRAMEVETDMGHILAFGLSEYFPGISRASKLREFATLSNGFIISAHPFRGLFANSVNRRPLLYPTGVDLPMTVEEAAGHEVFDLVDAIEVANGATIYEDNEFALKVAKHRSMKITGGSDAHSTHGLGRVITVFPDEIVTEEMFLNALHLGKYFPAMLSPNNMSETDVWVSDPTPLF